MWRFEKIELRPILAELNTRGIGRENIDLEATDALRPLDEVRVRDTCKCITDLFPSDLSLDRVTMS